MVMHTGQCHCGNVKFELEASADLDVTECNCSVCYKTGFLHLFVAKKNFRLLKGEGAQQTYTFGSGIAQHYFCETCGIKSFYVPRSHPDGYSVNVRCLDPDTIRSQTVTPFDGRNWDKNIDKLSPLSD